MLKMTQKTKKNREMNNKIIVTIKHEGMRLDKALSDIVADLSRNYISKLIEDGKVLLNGEVPKSSTKLKINDVISYEIPPLEELEIEKENIPLNIVYEDDDIAIINKEQGMVVHPAIGHHKGTLVNALLGNIDNLSGINGKIRPGIVHRLDKDTSGLLAVCKNDKSHAFLASQLKDHTMGRHYYALVKGLIQEDDGKIDMPIGRSKQNRQKMAVDPRNGKPAITFFHVVKRFCDYTLISCKLLTGRTHQIRVHLSHIGHPVVGDKLYGSKKSQLYNEGQLLHAYSLDLIHPSSKKKMTFTSPLPSYFQDIIDTLN